MTKIVAIHQPNFFPWLGYFDKIAKSDIFIFLDSVQFPKTGGVWCNRVKLLISGKARWITAAINRNYHGIRQINEMRFFSEIPWRKKLLKIIENEYTKHPFYNEVITIIEPLLLSSEENIAEYNVYAISEIAKVLGLDTTKLRRSSACSVIGTSNQLLCELTRAVDGSVYLCGGGAEGYQDDAFFSTQGVSLKYQNFQHPVYPQRGQTIFTPGLSVIDAAMNVGWQGVRKMLFTANDD
jgi:hypothetical protein